MGKINYGIIGFGGIAENRIAKEGFCADRERFKPHPLVNLVGVTDLNPDRKKAAAALGLNWYSNADAMLKDTNIQAVYIATNNKSHAATAETSLKKGKHCFIEKPMATTRKEGQRLVELARERNLSLAVDHMMTRNVYNIEAARLFKTGKIGEVNDICLHMEFLYGAAPDEAATWRCSDPEELGGPIGDVASHCLYAAEFLLDSLVTDLACLYTPSTLDIGVENGAFVQFSTGKSRGTVRVAFNQPRGGLLGTLSNLGYEVYGTEGVIRGFGTLFQLSGHGDEPMKIRLEIETGAGLETVKIDPVENIYQSVIGLQAQSIIDGKPLDGTDGLHNLELILACHESAGNNAATISIMG